MFKGEIYVSLKGYSQILKRPLARELAYKDETWLTDSNKACLLTFRVTLEWGLFICTCRSSRWKKFTLSWKVSDPPEEEQSSLQLSIDMQRTPFSSSMSTWSTALPMFLCRERMKVAARMFLSLQLSSTGGWMPSSTTSVRSLWTGSGPRYEN